YRGGFFIISLMDILKLPLFIQIVLVLGQYRKLFRCFRFNLDGHHCSSAFRTLYRRCSLSTPLASCGRSLPKAGRRSRCAHSWPNTKVTSQTVKEVLDGL